MRPEILFPLFAPTTSLKGVGPRVAPLLDKLAGPVVRDVLFLKPHSIVRRTPATVSTAIDGQVMTFEVTIAGIEKPRGPSQPWRMRTFDQSGFISLVFFGSFGSSLEHRHPPNARRIVSGKVEQFRDEWQMVHPDYMVSPDKAGEIPVIEPIYPATQGLPARTVRRFACEALERAPEMPEWQDAAWLAREKFPTWREALAGLHEPETEADLSPLSPHLRRLAYDELLAQQLAMAQRKAERRKEPAARIAASQTAERIRADLPFAFTGAQTRSLEEIRADLAAGERMSRLIQGDVGSGKTVVAMCAMADVAEGGGQSALMAPTEILARQHYETIAGPLTAHGVGVILLTGRDKGAARADKLRGLASGAVKVAVGTHALFQDDVAFHQLHSPWLMSSTALGSASASGCRPRAGRRTFWPCRHADPAHPGAHPIRRPRRLPDRREAAGRTPVATRAAPMTRITEVEDGCATRSKGAPRLSGSARWSPNRTDRPQGRRDPRRRAQVYDRSPASGWCTAKWRRQPRTR
jgi:ATP-dependent DNA helicase RecG